MHTIGVACPARRYFRFGNGAAGLSSSTTTSPSTLGSFLEIDKGKHGPGGVADAARTGGSQMPMAVEEM
jgi:hypothetical protein